MSTFSILGTILSHGFMVCGFLPIRIAFPVIAVLRGPSVTNPDPILLDSSVNYVSTHESLYIGQAITHVKQFTSFPQEMRSNLITTLSRLGCVEVPTPGNLRRLVESVTRYQFLGKPLGLLYTIHSGVPKPCTTF